MNQKRRRRSDVVADQICTMIQEKYHVHDKLPVESELTQMFSASRITIREAISKLSYLGIVDVRQGEGTFVNEVNLSNFTRPIKPFFTIQKPKIDDVFEFRLLLETEAVKLTAQRITQDEIDHLKKILDEMDDVLLEEDIDAYNTLDMRFHYGVVSYSHNELLSSIYALLLDIVGDIITSSTTQNSLAISVIMHKRIWSALQEHNSEKAYESMYTHIVNVAKFIANRKREQAESL